MRYRGNQPLQKPASLFPVASIFLQVNHFKKQFFEHQSQEKNISLIL